MPPAAGLTGTSLALLALAAVAAGIDWYAVSGARPRAATLEYVCKPAVPALLIAVAATLHPADATLRSFVIAALVFCLAGDVLLMLPGDSTALFGAGLGAFLVAHVLLIVGLADSMNGGGIWVVVALVGLAVVTAYPAALVVRAVARHHRPLLMPVIVYVGALLVMGAVAVAAGAGAGRAYRDVPLVMGALFFIASDTLLAFDRFVRPFPRAPLAVHATYQLALALLVLSLAVGPAH